ncbi:hypothetical protein ABZ491_16210 [Micromonospora rifamycinica]|uniref:hypothetical protein n=1 Tax=Micromonospora rifamycinica TaxID=291594 RepID=UPI0033ED03E0
MTAPVDPWAVALHIGGRSMQPPIGSGVVIDTNLVLACEHVVCRNGELRDDLWVSFPRAAGVGYWDRRQVGQCLHNGRVDKNVDLVLLELVEPVPASVIPARLRCLTSKELLEKPWWAYGFPAHTEGGRSAQGTIRSEGGWGRVHLVPDSGTEVVGGFSGAGLWSPDYQAVVGVIIEAAGQTGDGHALTLAHAEEQLPEFKLSAFAAWRVEDAGDSALAAWGWSLSSDEEAGRHWSPRARGVASNTEGGSRFRGRTVALRRLVDWLDQPLAAGRPLVVTGSPGVGKSAVLGRVVTTADSSFRAMSPADDTAERATIGSVSCAVHVKGKTALEVATEIARAAAVALPAAPVDLVPALRDRLALHQDRFTLVVDALDEAVAPQHARSLINDVLAPLARTGGVQVVVGMRRADSRGDLLTDFGSDVEIVDLDAPEFFAETDLADYAQATLQLLGAERPDNPYRDAKVAAPVARRIASLANGNFLIAGLIARARALRDTEAVAPHRVDFTATVADALDTYVAGLPPIGVLPARLALTVLAYAETPGLPIALWQAGTEALGGVVSGSQLTEFARTSAANFLVESGGAGSPTYRLFHQALNEALLANREEVGIRLSDEQRLVRTWMTLGRSGGWEAAPEYLLRSLPQHAAHIGLVDELLTDDGYLRHTHLDRLMPFAEAATGTSARARAQLLLRTPAALAARPTERAALWSVVDRLDQLGGEVPADDAPYFARWANTPARTERTVLEGHSQAVHDVCAVPVGGSHLLASVGEDGTVRLWDPLTNQSEYAFDCHDDCVRAVHAVHLGNEALVATGSHDGTVALWDPLTGLRSHELRGHQDWVRNLCTVQTADGPLLASASDDRTVRLWDPVTGTLRHLLTGHRGWVTAVTEVPVATGSLLASTGFDGTIRLWNPVTGRQVRVLGGHGGWVTTLCAVRSSGRVLLASAGYDGVVRLWNPLDGELVDEFSVGGSPLTDLCTVDGDDRCLLVATGEDGVIRLWDAGTGRHENSLRGQSDWIRAVCEVPMADRKLIATAGDDGMVRLWDPRSLAAAPVVSGGWSGPVTAVCAVPTAGEALVASAGLDGSVRLWSPVDGSSRGEPLTTGGEGAIHDLCVIDDEPQQLAAAYENHFVQLWEVDSGQAGCRMAEHYGAVNAVRAINTAAGMTMVSAGEDVTLRLWHPLRGLIRNRLTGHSDWVTALAVVESAEVQMLASGDKSGVVRLWSDDGSQRWQQLAHHDAVTALGAVPLDDRVYLASASADRTVGLWDCTDGRRLHALIGHTGQVTGVCMVPVGQRTLLASTSRDRTVRLWDPGTGRAVLTIPVHHPALTCCYVDDTLVVGLDRGLLALTIRP